MFFTYRLYKKRNTRLKKRVHSLLKEQLYRFTREEIFGKGSREKIRALPTDSILRFQIHQAMDRFERDEQNVKTLKERIPRAAEPYMARIAILTGVKGVGVFIVIAVIADSIEVHRFKGSNRTRGQRLMWRHRTR
ncbi:MAG: hypothetical protein LBB48_06800 [Treponema sp.]|nr:hypothetical protein [Treponema sp.]